jgi:hypothetical protein
MEQSGQLQVPAALFPGEETPIPTGRRLGVVRTGLVAVVRRKDPSPCQESKPVVHPVA